MPVTPDQRDLIPNTRTAAALRQAAMETSGPAGPGRTPSKREIEIDPDAPNAPTCSPSRYRVVDPDAPDAPVCKPRRYIVAPDPESLGRKALPGWARQLGDDLSESFGDRA
jgi:hypothetical protein